VKLGLFLAAVLAVAQPSRLCMGCDFAAKQLGGSDFSGVLYIGANFAGAALGRASFRGAKLVAANFERADLRGAAFDGVECTACNFGDAKLDGATFTNALMVAANFRGFAAAVADSQLRALLSRCISCTFTGASLAGRDLSGIALLAVDFSNADLRGTKFDGSELCWYAGNGAGRATKCDTMAGARMEGASLRGVTLCSDPGDDKTCTAVDAATLRSLTGSSLAGATLP
jgi:uncharacterized protein YjbI with pentapeptide repeats